MNERDCGGSAFPCMPPQDTAAGSAVGYPHPEPGMTLRDYFAAKAMQGIVSQLLSGIRPSDIELLAADAYAIADLMMKARQS